MCQNQPNRPLQSPTPEQLKFAKDLGLTIPQGATKQQVSRLIKKEVRRRGQAAMRNWRPKEGDLLLHPKHGPCQITRVGEATLKITLLILTTNRKVVTDAMYLDGCERIVDGRK